MANLERKDIIKWSIILGFLADMAVDHIFFRVPCPPGVDKICYSFPGFPVRYQFNWMDVFIIPLDFLAFPLVIFIILSLIQLLRKKT